MPKKERDTLCCKPALYPAAFECPGQVKQILHHHLFCKISRGDISEVSKQVTKLCQIIADGVFTVMTNI
jgi:hypothetical protein